MPLAPLAGVESIAPEELLEKLQTSPAGLTHEQAASRLSRDGPNAIPEKPRRPLLEFLSYFWGPIPWMIEIAAALSAMVGHWPDFSIIVALLFANAIVGFWEESHAGNAVAALKAKLAPEATARRDGAWRSIAARDLVAGDVIRVRLGDIVPADAMLLTQGPLEVDQSALTGESLPVDRSRGQPIISGSVVRRGEADAVVYATGSRTMFGRTARLVDEAHTVSHFQRAVLRIGDYLIAIAIVLVAIILAVALFRGDKLLTTLQFVLVLTVAAVPVALPTVLSVTMAVGARLLAKQQAVVTRLAAIEELAGVDVFCSDKTGTLTQNRLALGEPFVMPGFSQADLFSAAKLASEPEAKDQIDSVILAAPGRLPEGVAVVGFHPFDPVIKRSEARLRGPDGAEYSVSKGAPQVILGLAAPDSDDRARIEHAVEGFAARGFRSLGVARTESDGRWRMLGVLSMADPPRPDSKAVLEAAKQLGIGIKLITGDQVAIARETARELGLGTNIVDASLFGQTPAHAQARLAEAIDDADGFAQVYPEHKHHIVDVLQQRGHIVGMTGDGVNDAPALRKADAGIAVEGATDAAREASDIVLLTPGLSVIIDAIRESRRIFRRMTTYAIYRIAETIRVLLFMTLSILVFNFYPVTAVMIVLLALLNDGAILSLAYDRVQPSTGPERWRMGRVLPISTVLGIVGVISSFGLFYLAERVYHLDRPTLQTLMYLKFSVAGHSLVFAARTTGPFWSTRPAWIVLGATLGTQLVATVVAVYGCGLMPPLGWTIALLVWAYVAVTFVITDWIKVIAYRAVDRHGSPA